MPSCPRIALAAIAAATAVIAACSRGSGETDPCVPIVNGLVAFQPGLLVQVRDSSGRGELLGATITVSSGTDSLVAIGRDTLQQYAGYHAPGLYALRIHRRYYRDATVSNIAVAGGSCGSVATVTVPVVLALTSGAPALRAVDVLGAGFVNGAGQTLQLTARFDADATVSRAVTWRVSDTIRARIDANGLLSGKCVTVAKADTVTVLATADTTVRGSALFSVATAPSCS